MIARRSQPGTRQRGQVVVLFALVLFILMGMAAVAVDGGFGLVQQRRAQNGADFGAQAGTKMLASLCAGGNPPAAGAVYNEIQAVIDLNAPAVGSLWKAYYLDAGGADIPSSASPTQVTNNGVPPPNACGVRISLDPKWVPYIANVIGTNSLATTAQARSINSPQPGGGVGIVALDEVNPHQILGGGQGNFDVFGTIYANSSVPYHPWDGQRYWCTDAPRPSSEDLSKNPNCSFKQYVDVVDAKEGSKLILHGIMKTVSGNIPLDWCFGNKLTSPPGGWGSPPSTDNGGPPNKTRPTGITTPDPYNQALCGQVDPSTGGVDLRYDLIAVNNPQIPDPLLPTSTSPGLNDPFQKTGLGAGWTNALCPGESVPPSRIAPTTPDINGVYQFYPGDYAAPVIMVGAKVNFNDCGTGGYPGIYRFEGGLDLRPGSGQTVTGTNIMIATSSPLPEPGNVPGTVSGGNFTASGQGNGAPCFPEKPGIVYNANGGKESETTALCAGTNPSATPKCGTVTCPSTPNGPYYGVITYHMGGSNSQDKSTYGTGTNFSLILGGSGTISLSPPAYGQYKGVGLFQNRAVQGNFAMDAEPNDSATVTVVGLAYNGSDPCYGYPKSGGTCTDASNYASLVPNNPYNFWDTGTPFKPGGVMQAGLGMGTVKTPSGPFPLMSSGSVTIYGPCVVADFNTDGATTITIDGRGTPQFPSYSLPGVAPSGIPKITG
jgi:hypothetical protein